MDKKRLDYYKKKLLARREELLKTIARTAEEGRLAETQNAAITPGQREAERQDRHDYVNREFENGVEFGKSRRQHQKSDADDAYQR